MARPSWRGPAFPSSPSCRPTPARRACRRRCARLADAGATVIAIETGGADDADRLAWRRPSRRCSSPIVMIHRFYRLAEASRASARPRSGPPAQPAQSDGDRLMIVLSARGSSTARRFLDDHALVVEGERIAAIVPYAERPRGAAWDLGGGLLAPGFIDVQVNGGGGVLFNDDPTPEGIARIAAAHRKYGTVGLLPTLVTDAPQVMTRRHRRDARGAASHSCDARRPSGRAVHRSAPQGRPRPQIHPRSCARRHRGDRRRRLRRGHADARAQSRRGGAIAELARRGVLVSLGHSEASYEQARAAHRRPARARSPICSMR